MRIPRTTDEITPEWLTDALRAGGRLGDGRVDSVEFERIGVGLGFASLVARGSVEYTGDSAGAPQTLVAKLPSGHAETDALVTRMGLADREVRFFRELGADVGVPVPESYYADSDLKTGDFVLLLEDLSGARPGDQVNGCSPGDAELVVRNLARLHARWWDSDRLRRMDWLPNPAEPDASRRMRETYRSAWDRVSVTFGSAYPDGVYEIADRFSACYEEIMRPLGESPITLIHGDCRLGNLFFRDNGGDAEVVSIDWQLASFSRGATDLAYFFLISFPVEERREREVSLLRLYHATLTEIGISDYSYGQLSADYRRGMFRFLNISVVATANLDLDSEGGRVILDAVIPRLAGLADWDCGALIPD